MGQFIKGELNLRAEIKLIFYIMCQTALHMKGNRKSGLLVFCITVKRGVTFLAFVQIKESWNRFFFFFWFFPVQSYNCSNFKTSAMLLCVCVFLNWF